MSEAKFTPGPWKQDYPNSIISLDGKQIAITYNSSCDARLIAAAPDMFDAIKKALEIKQLWFPTGDYTVEHEGEAQALQSMFNALEAAINKATS